MPGTPDLPSSSEIGDTALSDGLARMLESARWHGVEMDADEAAAWLCAMQAPDLHQLTHDDQSGVFGARAALLDFDAGDLAEWRLIGELVRLPDGPTVRTALALSGSAAQSRIQRYPGDRDFMQRVHIQAPTREDACTVLGQLMREKALRCSSGPGYRFARLKFGEAPENLRVRGQPVRAGRPLEWTLDDVRAGVLLAQSESGETRHVRWEDAACAPGWCKLDWVLLDAARREVLWASNVLDPTWETPDGQIVTLDGQLEPMYQEIYLDPESAPLVEHLARQLDDDALSAYVGMMEEEVEKYLGAPPNYGKAARRLYNLFRCTGRFDEAAYLRELFDEPTTALYKVWAGLGVLSERATQLDTARTRETLGALMLTTRRALPDDTGSALLRELQSLHDAITDSISAEHHHTLLAVRASALAIVNAYFYTRLSAVPAIQAFLGVTAGQEVHSA
ncbi:hypothetical protein [Deinococcus peraridilitoris]|uniref:Uncharacterized protein n=1 Tax=Deinococcus peraridilitoris (strain DSM 19664 / LMG 22246 / CIP 109416 / KR-200) TaxID=937777 RepID=L0A1A2_DEIPD|nr:hypothetical protein [Deinococcus peraridilitoris]AFZ67663.1 hypothetical protein Deipe_2177 [Deinococcus peraridilitoris DSM 19664]